MASLFSNAALTIGEWLRLLEFVYPEVERRRTEVASLAREFYDAERALHAPSLPRNDRPLEGTNFQVFTWNMEPARRRMSETDSTQVSVEHFAMRIAREVENAGRNQIINAVENDPYLDDLISAYLPEEVERPPAEVTGLDQFRDRERPPSPTLVKGWARVATGRETCAWCLMLISRGAKYHTTDSAGINLDEETVVDLFHEAGGDLQRFRDSVEDSMTEWHTGCDCLVVPVFDVTNWPGLTAQKDAEQLWIDASREATQRIASGEARSSNHNNETLNALRRRLERGDLSMSDYALSA